MIAFAIYLGHDHDTCTCTCKFDNPPTRWHGRGAGIRHMRILLAACGKLAEFGTFSGKFHACLV